MPVAALLPGIAVAFAPANPADHARRYHCAWHATGTDRATTLINFFRESFRVKVAELQENAVRATSLLKVMANSLRLLTRCQLAEGEKSTGGLERRVGENRRQGRSPRRCARA